MAKQLSIKAEEKHIIDGDDSGSQGTLSSLPHDQDQSTKTSISAGSFPQGQVSLRSEDMCLAANYVIDDKMENILTPPPQDSSKSFQGVEDVKKQDDNHVGPVSVSSERDFQDLKGNPIQVQATDSQSSASFPMKDSLTSAVNAFFTVSPKLLLETDETGYGGGPCSAGASAVLDFMAEVLDDLMTEQIKAVPVLESILEMVPFYVDGLSRLMP